MRVQASICLQLKVTCPSVETLFHLDLEAFAKNHKIFKNISDLAQMQNNSFIRFTDGIDEVPIIFFVEISNGFFYLLFDILDINFLIVEFG